MAENETKNKTVSLDDVTKQVENMLAKAREEADRIIAEAKSSISAGAQPTEEQKKATAEREAYWNELVPVQLFKDNSKYKDDVFISVNGETCLIQRGPKVMIKRKFANVLENSSIQDYETSKLIEKKSNEFSKGEF